MRVLLDILAKPVYDALMNFISHAFHKVNAKGWPFVYFAIDVHDTIFKGTYKKNNEGKVFYPWAKEVLQNLSENPKVKLIIYTSSHVGPAQDVIRWLAEHDIKIFALNENPDHKGTELCDFSRKFYFDILFEDKGGFEGWHDWFKIMKELQRIGEWTPTRTHEEKMRVVHAIWLSAGIESGKSSEAYISEAANLLKIKEEELFIGFNYDYLDRAFCSRPLKWKPEQSIEYLQGKK